MSLTDRFFQDPLFAAINRVLVKETSTSWAPLMVGLAKELERASKRQANMSFAPQEDPVLTAVNRFLQAEKVRLDWRKIIYLGCSAGGDLALREVLSGVDYPHLQIVISMHHNAKFLFLSKLVMANGVEQQPQKIDSDLAIKSGRRPDYPC